MAEQWFYSSAGMKTGPISTEQLRQLVASGQLKPTDVVQRQGTQNWVAILSIDGLIPKAAPEVREVVLPEKHSPTGVNAAAIAMFIVAGAAMAVTGIGILALLAGDLKAMVAIAVALSLVHNCATIYATLQLKGLKSYRLATVGGYLVMGSWLWLLISGMAPGLPVFGVICGIAVGIWSLVVLRKPEVKAAFEKP